MSTLFITRGVPGSGKSTWSLDRARQDDTIRVNRDDIRFTLFGTYWGGKVDEYVVTDVENQMVESGLRAGRNVILDATNLHNKNLKTKLSLASRYGATVEFVDFPVSLATALERNASRERKVPERVITEMFRRYKIGPELGALPKPPTPLPTFEAYVPDKSLPMAYIVDTDGTVANSDGVRNPYDTSRYHLDELREHVAWVVASLYDNEHKIIALSGRDAAFREVTEAWWRGQNVPFDEFHFRPKNDTRMDAIIKYELFREHIAPRFNVLGAFDDRPQVIRMWRTIGVPVFDVGNGLEF